MPGRVEKPVVLVVDDEVAIAQVMGHILRSRGCVVVPVDGAPSAMAHLRRSPVDLILSDVDMPGMDGFAFWRAVNALRPDTPFVLMSSTSDVHDVADRANRESVSAKVVAKALTSEELVSLVDQMLAARRS